MNISGIQCLVQAFNVLGKIKGSCSCVLSNKNFKIDIEPDSNEKFKSLDLKLELQRLYFDL
jgi:hypothetical protein